MSRIAPLFAGLLLVCAPLLVAEEVPYEASRSLRSGSSVSWIEFDVEPNALYEVKAASLAFTPVIQVQRGDGPESTLRTSEGTVLHHHLISDEGSTMRLGVSSSAADGGNYLISLERVPVSASLQSGERRRGRLEGGDAQGTRGLVDWYRLRLRESGPVELSLRSEDFDTFLRVLNSDGTEATNDDGGQDRNSRLTFSGVEGEYAFVGVTSFYSSESGGYELSAQPIEPRATISTGQTLSGRLRDRDSGSDHLYRLEGEPGTRVVVQLESTSFDTVLHVSSPELGEMENDDAPGGSGTNSQLFFRLGESGSALIRVDRFGSDSGQYQLSVLEYVASGDTGRREPGYRLSSGDSLEQVITSTHRDSEGRLAHRYTFEAAQGEEITVTTRSGFFDTFLIVNGPADFHQEDDDGAGNRNSTLTFTAPRSGTYDIVVTSFSREGTGPYSIELMAQ